MHHESPVVRPRLENTLQNPQQQPGTGRQKDGKSLRQLKQQQGAAFADFSVDDQSQHHTDQ